MKKFKVLRRGFNWPIFIILTATLVVSGFFIFINKAQAGTLYVCPEISGECTHTSIQDAIDIAVEGDIINIASGSYIETLNLGGKALTIQGSARDDVIIDASSFTGCAIKNFGDSTIIRGLTLKGTTNDYGFKISHVSDITLENIKVENSYKTGIDLNTVDGATLNNIEVTDTVAGFGLMILDSKDIFVTNITTSGNTWGGVSVQTKNDISDSISFNEIFNVQENMPFLLEKDPDPETDKYHDITDVQIPDKFNYVVYDFRESGYDYKQWYYFETLDDSKTITQAFIDSEVLVYSDLLIYDIAEDNYYVIEGMLIQDAIDVATSDDTINVAAGIYNERIVINKPLTLSGATRDINKNGYSVPTNYAWDSNVESIINNPDPALAASQVVDIVSDDVIFEGFVVQSLNALPSSANDHLLRLNATTGTANDGNITDDTLDNIVIRNNIIGPNTNLDSQNGTMGRMGLYFASPNYSNDERGITDTHITGNKIIDSKGNGNNVFVWGAAENYSSPSNADYTGTIIEDNEISGSHRSGIEIAGGVDGLTIRNNSIHNNSGFTGDDPANLKYGNGILVIRMGSDKTSATAMGSENLVIENNQIYDNEKNAIYLGPINSDYTISGNEIYGNGQDSIRIDLTEQYHGGSWPVYDKILDITAESNKIYDNSIGIQVVGDPTNDFILNAVRNWWGDASGPEYVSNPGGTGDAISDNIDYSPWYANSGLVSLGAITTTDLVTGDTVLELDESTDIIANNIIVSMPAEITITATASWEGIINAPSIELVASNTPTPESGYNTTVETIIEVGYPDIKLVFNKAVKILIPDQAGKKVGYTRTGEPFTEITNVCSTDIQPTDDSFLPPEGDCKRDVNNDLVVWTKHFTQFIVYSYSPIIITPTFRAVRPSEEEPEEMPSGLSEEAQKLDTNKDEKIDDLDLKELIANWGSIILDNIADFNNDSKVDVFDFNLLMVHWTE